jgi:hypothetical protein
MLRNRLVEAAAEVAVSLAPAVSACYNFVHEGVESRRTVVIAPIHIAAEGGTKVSWACSLGPFCEAICRYSEAGRAARAQQIKSS